MSGIKRKPGIESQRMVIATYSELETFVAAFARNHINLLILIGAPGLSKSRTVKDALGERVYWVEGNATAFQIFVDLYRHRDQPVVINDVDALHADKNGIRLLKSLCDTDDKKRLAWHTAARTLKSEDIPREFTTTSRVAIISNDWRTLNKNVAAVEDRGHVVEFRPSAMEVHRKAGEWFDDTEIHEWIGDRLTQINRPSLRLYLRAKELKQSGLDWRLVVPREPEDQRRKLTLELLADESYLSQEARAVAFVQQGGGCRATYFNHVRRLREAGCVT